MNIDVATLLTDSNSHRTHIEYAYESHCSRTRSNLRTAKKLSWLLIFSTMFPIKVLTN